MVIEVSKNINDAGSILVMSEDERFINKFGRSYRLSVAFAFQDMKFLSEWCEYNFDEVCTFQFTEDF